MTTHIAGTLAPAVASAERWRIWEARGAENDRRRDARMRVVVVIATALAVVAIAVAIVS